MLFQPTNIIPDVRTGIGLGVVDASDKMQVSWQVNGDFPRMTGFVINIYANDAASTLKLRVPSSGIGRTNCPFDGRNANGEVNFFSYAIGGTALSGAGITNGNEYKFTITQYYMDNGVETSIVQSSASVFITRAAPSFTVVTPSVTSAEYTFSWSFSQAQGDTVEWLRYQIRLMSGGDAAIIYDSGSIYGTAVYQCTYSGFLDGETYAVRAIGQTSSGVPIETQWTSFITSYSGSSITGTVTAKCVAGFDAVLIEWADASTGGTQDAWVLYRKQSNNLALLKIGEFPVAQRSVYDFGAASGQGPYSYILFQAKSGDSTANPPTQTQYLSKPLTSNEVTPKRHYWSLLEATENGDSAYRVINEFDFKNNLDSGSFTNNNEPNVMQNFTAMPTVQLSPSNYKSGSLTALLGKTSGGSYVQDTLTLREKLMALSTTQNVLFLKSSKGDVMTIAINGAISAQITDTSKDQPQSVTVPWVEIDDTPVSLIAYPGDALFN